MSSTYDPSRDQTNSLGGPSQDFPGMGAGLDGGGSGGGSSNPTGGFMAGDVSLSGSNPVHAPTSTPTPFTHTNVDPPPVIPPAVPAKPAAPSYTPSIGYAGKNTPHGFSGGELVNPTSGAPAMGGGAKVGMDGGGTAAGPGQFFAEGGAVEGDSQDDGADPQGAMGNDPMSQMISAAMDSVDKAFAYGRQKNGLMQQAGKMPTKPGQQSETPGSQEQPAPGALASDDGDQDDAEQGA